MKMFDASQLVVFVAATLTLVAIPGPAVVYLVTMGATEGRLAGAKSAAGVAVGNFGHALLAAFGVSAVFASSSFAFTVLKVLGAAYLVYLGIRYLGTRDGGAETAGARRGRARLSVFAQGALVGILNPKVALFLIAFLPQFANRERGPMWIQLLLLGTIFVMLGWVGDTCWALVAGSLVKAFRAGDGVVMWGRRLSGVVLIGLGLFVIWER